MENFITMALLIKIFLCFYFIAVFTLDAKAKLGGLYLGFGLGSSNTAMELKGGYVGDVPITIITTDGSTTGPQTGSKYTYYRNVIGISNSQAFYYDLNFSYLINVKVRQSLISFVFGPEVSVFQGRGNKNDTGYNRVATIYTNPSQIEVTMNEQLNQAIKDKYYIGGKIGIGFGDKVMLYGTFGVVNSSLTQSSLQSIDTSGKTIFYDLYKGDDNYKKIGAGLAANVFEDSMLIGVEYSITDYDRKISNYIIPSTSTPIEYDFKTQRRLARMYINFLLL
ncbi:hypothetical protein [Candidatus Deianiraea vastatrix]|uniref:Uncharacterized protein n=1 Tax=Candidatus Deianiraea vastatrix TaxID=2163644 RepID=A0A5B8XD65_9RICK|nr:hypothetical protein [Candidatus Deianiraea vastatrix]QED23268.1 hypothetical protein Deia_00468 [Candidatus Deianiraea vastatrix]